MGIDAKRLVELLDERSRRTDQEAASDEFRQPGWAPRSDEEIVADIQAVLDGS